jgi:putative OPT family oligopeptide transporter
MPMREFTLRAVLIGLPLTAILGFANAYLGLKAGMTIAATYPAAVVGMTLLRLFKGSILEENMTRTIGSIGEAVAAGAVFTIPAFVLAGVWPVFDTQHAYWKSAALMAIGGTLGILFVTLLRRVMVEDPELPYPEAVAASEIHKAGQQGARAAKILFANMGFGAVMYFLSQTNLFWYKRSVLVRFPAMLNGLRIGQGPDAPTVAVGGMTTFTTPAVSPAYLGVGYIIGLRNAALTFAGGMLSWGLLVPLLIYFLGPTLPPMPAGASAMAYWGKIAGEVWYSIVRPIAVGGMLVGAGFTLFRMRKQLGLGLARAISDLKKSAAAKVVTDRTQRDLSTRIVFAGIFLVFLCMVALYFYFSGTLPGAVVAAAVMLVLGFLFAAVAGSLVGMIGSSNNPISGLTLCTLIVAALLMVALGVLGSSGVAAVLGVAAVVCVSSSVAGEMLQDLKVGYILGGTPAKMEIGDLLGIVVCSLVLFFPLMMLHQAYTFGSAALPAPQAGLMAMLAQGIVRGNMPWPLVIVGIFMGLALVMVQVRSPMLLAVGMYLPLETTFALFVGGVIRWITDVLRDHHGYNEAQKARVDNTGVLTASGLIAGESLCGIAIAAIIARRMAQNPHAEAKLFQFASGNYWISGLVGLALLVAVMIWLPLANHGGPDEPAPPTAIV